VAIQEYETLKVAGFMYLSTNNTPEFPLVDKKFWIKYRISFTVAAVPSLKT
jgi:hypothetical protein